MIFENAGCGDTQDSGDLTVGDTLEMLNKLGVDKGQRKQLLKNEKIKKAFDFFKVEYEG